MNNHPRVQSEETYSLLACTTRCHERVVKPASMYSLSVTIESLSPGTKSNAFNPARTLSPNPYRVQNSSVEMTLEPIVGEEDRTSTVRFVPRETSQTGVEGGGVANGFIKGGIMGMNGAK